VLKYLTRYVRSGPLHEAQIVQADDDGVAFRYLDHRTGTVRLLRTTPPGFVARYLQHALPARFHRIRHYGFLAPSRRHDLRALQIALLDRYTASALAPPPRPDVAVPVPPPCPYCGSTRPRWRVYIPASQSGIAFTTNWRAPPARAS